MVLKSAGTIPGRRQLRSEGREYEIKGNPRLCVIFTGQSDLGVLLQSILRCTYILPPTLCNIFCHKIILKKTVSNLACNNIWLPVT